MDEKFRHKKADVFLSVSRSPAPQNPQLVPTMSLRRVTRVLPELTRVSLRETARVASPSSCISALPKNLAPWSRQMHHVGKGSLVAGVAKQGSLFSDRAFSNSNNRADNTSVRAQRGNVTPRPSGRCRAARRRETQGRASGLCAEE